MSTNIKHTDTDPDDTMVEVQIDQMVKGDAVDTGIPVVIVETLVPESETVRPEVKWQREHRQFRDKPWGVLYVLCVLLFVGLGSFLVVNARPRYEWVALGEGVMETDETIRIVSSHFRDDVTKCCATHDGAGGAFRLDLCSEVNVAAAMQRKMFFGRRRLLQQQQRKTQDNWWNNTVDDDFWNNTALDNNNDDDAWWNNYDNDDYATLELEFPTSSKYEYGDGIFDAFLERPEILITLTLLALALALIWVILLRFFAVPIVYATEVLKVAGLIYLAVVAFMNGASVAGFVSMACAATLVAWAIYTRNQLVFAGKMLAEAARAFKENATMFFAFMPILLLYAGYAGLFVLFFARSFENVEVQAVNNSCVFVSPSYTTGMVFFISLAYLWSVLLFATMRLSIIANIIGSWHFHPEKTPSLGRAIVNSCTTSMGTLTVASLISTIAEKLNRMFAKERLMANCFNPIFWVVFPLYLVFGSCLQLLIQMLTKFSVVLHVFTGESWMGSAKKVVKIMKRHFLGGFVTATSSSSVLNLGCYVFSVGIYFVGWVWLDKAFHTSTFIGISDEKLFAVFWLFFALFNIYYPVLGIYFIILLNRWLSSSSIGADPAIWLTPLAAAFIGCIAMMFFNYLAGTFTDTVDVLFLCFAIDRDNKKDLQEDEFAKLVFEGIPNVLVEPALEEVEKSIDEESAVPVAVASIEAP